MARLAVVSGGGTGLGRAIARRLARDGDRVVILGRRAEVLRTAAEDINTECGDDAVTSYSVDLTEPDQVESVAAQIAELGTVDVIVNNAGGGFAGEMESLAATAEGWRRNFDGNVLSAVLLTEALLPHVARPGGRIVAISSIAGLRGAGSYGAAKAAMNAWALSLATELVADEVTVNVVAPGFVPDTDFWHERFTDEQLREWNAERAAKIPMGRPGTPDEIAAAVAYLAAPDAGWTTGQILQVNGGELLGRG